MRLLAVWWQFLLLVALYFFLFLLYKEMTRHHLSEPAALLLVVNGPVGNGENQWPEGQIMLLYPQEPIALQGEKVFVKNETIYLNRNGNICSLVPGDTFDFAGGSLQLVRWNNARQLIN
ncbi:MAG: hypothetical protein ACOWWO_10750 [Peptococcaceae bacterium]